MKNSTASKLAQAIQLLILDGFENYTFRQLSKASGIGVKTLQRNKDLVQMLDFAINKGGYKQCLIVM